jgi:hypothetical protein
VCYTRFRSINTQRTLSFHVQGDGVRQILYSADLAPSLRPQLQAIVLGVQKEEVLYLDLNFLLSFTSYGISCERSSHFGGDGRNSMQDLLRSVAEDSGIMSRIHSSWLVPDDKLLLVLLYEVLLGSRRVRGTSKLVQCVKVADALQCLAPTHLLPPHRSLGRRLLRARACAVTLHHSEQRPCDAGEQGHAPEMSLRA